MAIGGFRKAKLVLLMSFSMPNTPITPAGASSIDGATNPERILSVHSISKIYQKFQTPSDRLKQFVLPRVRSILGLGDHDYFHEFRALDQISFDVLKGETIGIIGQNGSGKSTLLQIITGTTHPSSGNIQTHGKIAALLELGAGFNPEFTGRENVLLSGAIYGLTADEIAVKFDAIVDFSGIRGSIDQPVKTYSSGMLVRLAFSVVAHVDADILIIDEALAVGDAFFVQKCMRFLREFKKNGTILFVSHDSGAVVNLCDRAILIDHGKVIIDGDPKSVTEYYLSEVYTSLANEKHEGGFSQSSPQEQRDPIKKQTDQSDPKDHVSPKADVDNKSFGSLGMQIETVELKNLDGSQLQYIVGGETVRVKITAQVFKKITEPIAGFFIKDRLGQTLFGENTYLTYQDNPLSFANQNRVSAEFTFVMPILPPGDYSICASLAEGTQEDHIQHHWIHDALVFKSHSKSMSTGLVGIPMLDVSFKIDSDT